MYPPHHLGGYELMWRSAVARLRERGHQVRVLTTDYRAPRPDPAIAKDPDVHRELRWYWRDHAFPRLSARERIALERHNRQALERHLTDLRPDAVNWWAMGGMSLSLIERVRRAGLPALAVVVDDWLLYGPEVDAWLRLCRRLGPLAGPLGVLAGTPRRVRLEAATRFLFVSETVRRRAHERGYDLGDSIVAHAGIESARFAPAPERPWRGRLLYLGRIDERKGIATALRALPLLDSAALRIVGSGDDEHLAGLRALAAELGVGERVSFETVPRDEVAAVYAGADALLFPVLWEEPFGLVPLEAMASGTPVIATGAGGSGEYLRDGENCLLFAPRDDPAALAAAVERLAADDALRARLRAAGLETAARFDERAFNDAVADALEALVR